MSSYKKYPKYIDSNIEWLGEVPEHWKIESLRNILTERNEKNNPIRSKERLSLSIAKGVTLYAEKTTNLDRFKDDFTKYKLAYEGDLVFNSMNMIVGAVGVSEYFGCVSPIYYTYNGGLNKSNTKFYEYLFRCKTVQGVLYTLGKGLMAIDRGDGKYNTLRLKISRDDLRSLRLPFPPLEEQTAIANFLDEKTSLIDESIKNKQALIALLKEQKTAIINKAVTKGLNPDVPMKDRGIEWLGEIPEHWNVKRLKLLSKIKTGEKDTVNKESNGLYPFYVRSDKVERISTFSYEGEAVLTAGDGAGVAKVFHYVNEKFDYHQRVYKVSDFKEILGKFFYYYIKANFIKEVLKISAKTTVDSLRLPMLSNFPVVVPPKKEQVEIFKYIDNQINQINNAVEGAEKEIKILEEYKQSLISEAVTGKIDVRAEVAVEGKLSSPKIL